jgi:hypothetical protein
MFIHICLLITLSLFQSVFADCNHQTTFSDSTGHKCITTYSPRRDGCRNFLNGNHYGKDTKASCSLLGCANEFGGITELGQEYYWCVGNACCTDVSVTGVDVYLKPEYCDASTGCACTPGNEDINGVCVKVCDAGYKRVDGTCKKILCEGKYVADEEWDMSLTHGGHVYFLCQSNGQTKDSPSCPPQYPFYDGHHACVDILP